MPKRTPTVSVTFHREQIRSEFGPFIAVGVESDHIRVSTVEYGLPVLAVRTADGWEVNGLPGESFEGFSVYATPAE